MECDRLKVPQQVVKPSGLSASEMRKFTWFNAASRGLISGMTPKRLARSSIPTVPITFKLSCWASWRAFLSSKITKTSSSYIARAIASASPGSTWVFRTTTTVRFCTVVTTSQSASSPTSACTAVGIVIVENTCGRMYNRSIRSNPIRQVLLVTAGTVSESPETLKGRSPALSLQRGS